jgi:hypothetical protein
MAVEGAQAKSQQDLISTNKKLDMVGCPVIPAMRET